MQVSIVSKLWLKLALSPFCVLLDVEFPLVAHPYLSVTCPGRVESHYSSQVNV